LINNIAQADFAISYYIPVEVASTWPKMIPVAGGILYFNLSMNNQPEIPTMFCVIADKFFVATTFTAVSYPR
jgi:hypothetical protein